MKTGPWWFRAFIFSTWDEVFPPHGHFQQKHHMMLPGTPKLFNLICSLESPTGLHIACSTLLSTDKLSIVAHVGEDVLFITGDWNAKVRSQETPGVKEKFGLGIRNEAGQRLIEFCPKKNALVIANTLFQQHKRRVYMDITRWSTLKSDWLYSLQQKMEKLSTVNKNKTRSWRWLRSRTPYAKFRLKLKKLLDHSGMT